MLKKLIIASTSTIHGGNYLEYLLSELEILFSDTQEILFIPYAKPGGISYNDYTEIVSKAFQKINKKIIGVHTYNNPIEAVENAKGIFTGGGNTFVLVNQLYKTKVMPILRDKIYQGIPYLGTSAGSNICGLTMQTTNDMPITYPPSFKTLGIIPFNINPHYLDPIENSTHMGETRETRIKEFHGHNSIPVIGLREGSWLHIQDQTTTLKGKPSARIFEKDKTAYEIEEGSQIIF